MKWDIRIHITLATCLKKRKDVLQVNIDQGGCNEKICERIYCSISAVLNRKKTKMVKDGRDNSCVSGDYHASCYHDKF